MKSYHLYYLPRWMPLVMYIVFPVLFLLFFTFVVTSPDEPMLIFIIACTFLIDAELFMDYLCFMGINSKETNKLEYIKTSPKGMTILRKIIMCDGIRRFATTFLLLFALYIFATPNAYILIPISMSLLTLLITELFLIVIRFFNHITFIILASILSSMGFGILANLIHNCLNLITLICLAFGYLLVAATGRIITLRKGKMSYYDTPVKKIS